VEETPDFGEEKSDEDSDGATEDQPVHTYQYGGMTVRRNGRSLQLEED